MSRPLWLALTLLCGSPASAEVLPRAVPAAFRPVTPRQAAFLSAVDDWSALLPPDPLDPVVKKHGPVLEKIKSDASTSEAAKKLDPIEQRFEDWKTAFLRDLYRRTHYDFFSDPKRFETYMQERLTAVEELKKRSAVTRDAAKIDTYEDLRGRVGDSPDRTILDYIYDKLGLKRSKTLEFSGKAVEAPPPAAATRSKIVFSPAHVVSPEDLPAPPAPFLGKDSPAYLSLREHLVSKGVSGKVVDLVFEESSAQGADPLLILAVIKAESYFNPRATSPVNARGLMQLMDGTARMMGISNPEVNSYDPKLNVKGGVKFLTQLWAKFVPDFDFADLSSKDPWTREDVKRVIASYNAGPGNAYRWTHIKETADYVPKVLGFYTEYKRVAAEA